MSQFIQFDDTTTELSTQSVTNVTTSTENATDNANVTTSTENANVITAAQYAAIIISWSLLRNYVKGECVIYAMIVSAGLGRVKSQIIAAFLNQQFFTDARYNLLQVGNTKLQARLNTIPVNGNQIVCFDAGFLKQDIKFEQAATDNIRREGSPIIISEIRPVEINNPAHKLFFETFYNDEYKLYNHQKAAPLKQALQKDALTDMAIQDYQNLPVEEKAKITQALLMNGVMQMA